MLNRQAVPAPTVSRQRGIAPASGAMAQNSDTDRHGNDQIKRLLKHFGLRTSLVRLKVLDALLAAIGEDQPVGVRGLHSRLNRLDTPISFLSVREVLKRLCDEGVITLQDDKTYHLHSRTEQWLNDQPRDLQ